MGERQRLKILSQSGSKQQIQIPQPTTDPWRTNLVLVERSTVHVVHLHVDALVLGVVLDGGPAVLPAYARHFVPAKGQLCRREVECVDPGSARLGREIV